MRRKLSALLVILAMIGALLTGCYAEVERGIEIKGDDKFTFKAIVYMTEASIVQEYGSIEEFNKAAHAGLEKEIGKDKLAGWTTRETAMIRNGITWCGYGIYKDFTLSELQAFFDSYTKYGKINISMSGFIVKEFKVNITANSTARQEEGDGLAALIADGGSDFFSIHPPYTLQEHNGTPGNRLISDEVIWNLNSLADGTQSTMELKITYLNMPVILFGALGLVVFILILMLVMVLQRRKKKTKVEPVDILAATMAMPSSTPMSSIKAFVPNEYAKKKEEEEEKEKMEEMAQFEERHSVPKYVRRKEEKEIEPAEGPIMAPFDSPDRNPAYSSVQLFKPVEGSTGPEAYEEEDENAVPSIAYAMPRIPEEEKEKVQLFAPSPEVDEAARKEAEEKAARKAALEEKIRKAAEAARAAEAKRPRAFRDMRQNRTDIKDEEK